MAAPGILARLGRPAAGFVMAVGTALGPACASAPALATPPAATSGPVAAGAPARSGAVASSAPAAAHSVDPAIPTLELVDVVIVPRGDMTLPRERQFGSLSGLVRDDRTGHYLSVIDDRLPARVAWLDIRYNGQLEVTPLGVEPVTAGPGVDARAAVNADLEAVAALPDGSFVVTEEGHVSKGEADQPPAGDWPALLMTLSAQAVVTALHPWPSSFDLGPENGGIRENQGAEALTRTPDGRLVAGLEQPRFADQPGGTRNGHPFNDGRGGPGRLIEFVDDAGRWQARQQWLYRIEPTGTREGFDTICDDGENGLTELLALDNTRFLALERSCLQNTTTRAARNTEHLFLVDVAEADDVSGIASLAAASVRGVTKKLLLDFDTLIPRLPPSLANLDNFEGLAFGPTLPDGSRTLLVLSDDNFRPTQQTVVLLFNIK